MASANDGANLLAEYVGEGTIADGVAKMNARVEELGLAHTHFANPHGISDEDHYTSCYDMAQILRWALTQPGFETLFTRNEMYTMAPTNIQPVTRYFHQQDKMGVGSSRYYIPAILGSKIGYTNIARYSYVCLWRWPSWWRTAHPSGELPPLPAMRCGWNPYPPASKHPRG